MLKIQAGKVLLPMVLSGVLFTVMPTLSGCSGEAKTTGMVAHDDPDADLRTKEMEDFMAKQNAPKKKR